MPNDLIPNPKYDPTLGATPTNQPYVFASPETAIVNPQTQQTAAQAITASDLMPTTPLPIAQPEPQSQTAEGILGGAEQTSKTIQDYIKEQTPPETDLSRQIKSLMEETTGLLPSLQGRGAAQATAETTAGVPTYSKELADLNAQILTKLAEHKATQAKYQTLSQQQEGKPITMASIIGSQAQIQKMALAEQNAAAADVGLLQARALGLQGQLEAAQKAADRSVDLMYEDREAVINTKLKQLELLYPELTKQEKIYADAQANKLKDEQAKIDEQKQTTKDNIKLGIQNNVTTQFYNYGGEIRQTSTGKAFSTEEEFIKATGMNVAQATVKGLITDITGEKWSEPYLMGGDYVQKNLKTGEIRTAVNVAAGGGVGITEVSPEVIADYARRLDVGEIQLSNVPEKIRNQVLEQSIQAKEPRDFTDEEIRQLVREDKNAGSSYEDIVSAIDAFPQLKNKDRAKLIVDEIFGVKTETKTGLYETVSSFFSRLFGR